MSKLTSELDNIEKNKRPISKWTPEQLKYFEYLENIVNAIPKRYGTHYVTPSVSSYDIKESNDLDNLQEMVNAIPKGYSITVPENESKSNTFLKTQRRKNPIEDPNCKTSVNNNSVKCRSLNNKEGIPEEEGIHIPEENNKIIEETDIEIQEEADIHIPEENDYKELDNTKPRYRKLSKTIKLKKGGNKTKRRRLRGLTRRGVRRTNNKRRRSIRWLNK